jgi:hypothetical protein
VKYEGNTKEIFLDVLAAWNFDRERLALGIPGQEAASAEAAYINVNTIIQSSGTGKSRLLHETAEDIFTIPINLRDSNREYSLIQLSPPSIPHQSTRWLPPERRDTCGLFWNPIPGF